MRDSHFRPGRLVSRAVISVQGPEAGSFLHNLLTADIDRLASGDATYAALLSPQGKIIADIFVLRQDDGYLIDCASSQRADLLKRLWLYRLRARVEIAPRDELLVTAAPSALPGGYADPRTAAIGWRAMTGAAAEEAQGYDAARIALGLADTDQDLGSGEFFPHEANLDQLGGVSFRKGCYVGQEVVSRMEHRATARSRILPVTLAAEAPPKGTDIRAGEKQVGTLLSSMGETGLALIRLDRLAEATSPLEAAGICLSVRKAPWARYDVAGAA